MQTSKSYGTRSNNIEVKLELDDLEYVFSDGRNLIINSDANSEETDEGNIVYTDGSQAVVLQSGVKHYIQTLGGDTYLLGNESDNIQQLVINAEDQSEESNSEIEYVQRDENGDTVIYKLANTEDESQPQTKRFKIGDAEYVTLSDSNNVQRDEDNQVNISNENSMSETTNFQYAILKDGKLQLRLCDTDYIDAVNDSSNEEININELYNDLQEESQEYIGDKSKIPKFVLINTDLPAENTMGLKKLAGKDLLTGKTITLDEYLSQMQYKTGDIENVEDDHTKRKNNQGCDQFLNKKLLIRKNANGKSLFGKILHIEPAIKTDIDEETHDTVETEDGGSSEAVVLDVDPENVDVDPPHPADDEIGIETLDLPSEDPEQGDSVQYSMVYNQDITPEHVNFLTKTLYGLVDVADLRKKLLDHRLEIKYLEKRMDDGGNEAEKEIRYVSGYLCQDSDKLVLDDSEQLNDVTSLTVVAFCDTNSQRTTKVIFHEKLVACQFCSRTFRYLDSLDKHMEMAHNDRTCNICRAKFANHVLLNEHRKAHGHYFDCKLCNKRFTAQCSLKRHLATHDLKTLQCVICKNKFANISNLSKHLLSHSHIKAYRCDTCGKYFMSFVDLNVHRKMHNPIKYYYCDICGREFSRHSNLSRHSEIHKGEGNLYKCGICECSYKFVSSLTRHIVQHHMKQTV